MNCAICQKPIEKMYGVWLHDNSNGDYAGTEIDHDPEPDCQLCEGVELVETTGPSGVPHTVDCPRCSADWP